MKALLFLFACSSLLAQIHVNGLDQLREMKQTASYSTRQIEKADALMRDIEKELQDRLAKKLVTPEDMVLTLLKARQDHAHIAHTSQLSVPEVREVLENLQALVFDTYYELEVLQLLSYLHERNGDQAAQLMMLDEFASHPEFGRHPDCNKLYEQFQVLKSRAELMHEMKDEMALFAWEQYFQAFLDADCKQGLINAKTDWQTFVKLAKKADQEVPEHLQSFFEKAAESQPRNKPTDPQKVNAYEASMIAVLKDNAGL